MPSNTRIDPDGENTIELLKVMLECDRVLIEGGQLDARFDAICRSLASLNNVDAAWIGMPDANGKGLWLQAHHGNDPSYLEFVEAVAAADAPLPANPVRQALATCRPVWSQDIAHCADPTAFSAPVNAPGWSVSAVLPLTTDGAPVGVLLLCARIAHAFNDGAQKLLLQLASNVSHALDHLANDARRRLAEEALAESEARYCALFVNNCMPMLLVNPDNARIVDVNLQAVSYYGWDKATLTSMQVMDINTLTPQEVRAEMALAASSHKTFFSCRHRLASGELRDVEAFSSLVNFKGEALLLLTIHDVTERQHEQLQMKSMQRLLQRFIDEFPGTIYVKDQQLRLLMVNQHLVQALGVPSDGLIGKTAHEIFPKEFADVITELDLHMLADGGRRTVEEAFNGRHLETHMFVIENDAGERLQAGIESTINVVWNQLKYKVQVIREYVELPHVHCVISQINQVLMSLLVNAGQAIAERGTVTIRTGVGDDQVWIEVQDTGCGIASEKQARVFEPFYTTKAVGLGTGLGLSIAADIISRHRGKILLQSVPGVGSTFRIVLPINARQAALEPGHTAENQS